MVGTRAGVARKLGAGRSPVNLECMEREQPTAPGGRKVLVLEVDESASPLLITPQIFL
jgi:hypothetical protein